MAGSMYDSMPVPWSMRIVMCTAVCLSVHYYQRLTFAPARLDSASASYTVMACIVTAYVVMDFTGKACIGMAYVIMDYTGMAYINMACVVIDYAGMAYIRALSYCVTQTLQSASDRSCLLGCTCALVHAGLRAYACVCACLHCARALCALRCVVLAHPRARTFTGVLAGVLAGVYS